MKIRLICDQEMRPTFSEMVLGKYKVQYFFVTDVILFKLKKLIGLERHAMMLLLHVIRV